MCHSPPPPHTYSLHNLMWKDLAAMKSQLIQFFLLKPKEEYWVLNIFSMYLSVLLKKYDINAEDRSGRLEH